MVVEGLEDVEVDAAADFLAIVLRGCAFARGAKDSNPREQGEI